MELDAAVLESYWALGVFLVLFVASRMIVRSAVQFLDDESKIKLVNAAGKFNWMYFVMLATFALFFVNLWLGFAACIAYFLFGVVFNFIWAKKSGLPVGYRKRVALGHGFLLLGFVVLGVGSGFMVFGT
jgi:hypothetical protein